MDVIRKKLTPDEIHKPDLRYNTTTHTVQRTIDGGTTWVNSAADDPRYNPASKLAPRTGSNIPCNTAANAVYYLQTQLNKILDATGVASAIVEGIGVLAMFFPEVGILVDILADVVSAVLGLGASYVAAAMTTAVYHTLRDIIACNIAPDGSVSHQ